MDDEKDNLNLGEENKGKTRDGQVERIEPFMWKAGEPSPNPNGRPKGSLNTKTIIRKWLESKERAINPITGESLELSQLDIITLAQITKAQKGDTVAFNALLDRTDGKPTQAIEATGKNGAPLYPQIVVNQVTGLPPIATSESELDIPENQINEDERNLSN